MSSLDPNFAERSRAILQEMAEAGLNLVYKLAATHDVTGETALAYSRLSKAVRQTIAFEARLADEHHTFERAAAERQLAERRKAERETFVRARNARMDETQEIIERLIEVEPAERREDLADELEEWLFDPRADDIFDAARPLGELIASIAKDLGLAPDWTAFAAEPWAAEVLAGQDCARDPPQARTWTAEVVTPPSGPQPTRPERAPPDG